MKIKWKSAPVKHAFAAFAAPNNALSVSPALDQATDMLPDLSGLPQPLDKARALLHAAAEVEHMLLIQYLYASLTLKAGTQLLALPLPQQQAVRSWAATLKTIAIEEMGHLMSVQNLLLLIGEDPSFKREEFPPPVDGSYPFDLHLEPLSKHSLAKYILAEAPISADATLDEFRKLVPATVGAVKHVGVIYGLLAVIFSKGQLTLGATPADDWETFVQLIASKCGALQHPELWLLDSALLHPGSEKRQGHPTDFDAPVPGFFFATVTDLKGAYGLVRDIGLQGEAPVDAPTHVSHYLQFRRMFEGSGTLLPFPLNGEFDPAFDVGVDPKLSDYTDNAHDLAAQIDAAYATMLQGLNQYLSADAAGSRADIANAAVDQMHDVRQLSKNLLTFPQHAGTTTLASPVFSVPAISKH